MKNKVFEFLGKYWLFVLLGTLATIVVALKIITSQKTPPPSPIKPVSPTPSAPVLKLEGKALPQNTRFLASTDTLPKTAKTYQGREKRLPDEQANQIAQKLGFAQPPTKDKGILGTFYFWNSEDYSLNILLDLLGIDYNLNGYQTLPKEGELPSQSQAQTILDNLLDELGLQPSFELIGLNPRYFKIKGTGFIETTPQEADFLQVGFVFSFQNSQLVSTSLFEPDVYLRIGRGGKLARFRYKAYFSEFTEERAFPLKNQEQIVSTLVSEGKIIDQDFTSEAAIWGLDFTEAEFDQISLVYYEPTDKNQLVQPIYFLSGKGTLADGQQTRIVAYLPALQP